MQSNITKICGSKYNHSNKIILLPHGKRIIMLGSRKDKTFKLQLIMDGSNVHNAENGHYGQTLIKNDRLIIISQNPVVQMQINSA